MTQRFHKQALVECAAGQEPWHPQAGSTLLPGAPTPLAYSGLRIWTSLAIGLAAFFSTAATASDADMGAAQGMGHTSRSSLEDGGAAYTAPATLWLNAGFDVAGGAQISSSGGRLYQFSALDSQTGPVGLGVTWFRHDRDLTPSKDELPGWKKPGQSLDNPTQTQVFAASLGTGGVHHLFSYAVGFRYYMRSAPVTGDETELNAVASLGVVAQDQFVLTLTAVNLVPQTGFDGAPLSVGTGTRWQPTDSFALAVDTLTDLESREDGAVVSPMVGAEYRVQGVVPVRLGWTRDNVSETSFATAGVGVSNEQAGLDYGARLELGATGDPKHWHGLSLRATF